MRATIYNIVGTDGTWFSPFGWRARALLLAKEVEVEWVDVPVSKLAATVAFAETRSAPLLVLGNETGESILYKDTASISRIIDRHWPSPTAFPDHLTQGIALMEELIDVFWQVPGFAAWAPTYFDRGVISGEDENLFRGIIARATGRSVEENRAIQPELIAAFHRNLAPLERKLQSADWLLGEFSYADVLLYSCVKCFAAVNGSIDPVLGPNSTSMRAWYARMEVHCKVVS